MKTYLQKMGRSLMLPVAVLPAAALLVGVSMWLPQNWMFAKFLTAGSNAILGSLPILFAIGLALGMSKGNDGAAALAGLVGYLIPTKVLAPESVATLMGMKVAKVDPAYANVGSNVFIGILAGLIAAALYDRFFETKLPMALSFFSGKRLVPIITAAVMLVITAILMVIWPPIYEGLVAFGKFIVGLGATGAGLYGLFNRLLIPTGLHQALNSVFWFDTAGINDIGKFWLNKGTKGVTGMYQAGFFPVMMFGLPAGALAMYRNAREDRKKQVGGLLLAGAFASFFTGVTEPLEFSFMFIAWPLYLIHAVLTGLSLSFAALMHWTAGFAFSAGLVDYTLSFHMSIANKPYMLLVQGLVMAVIYYFTFDFAIKKFNLMTPGREPEIDEAIDEVSTDINDDKYMIQAKKIYAAIGGKQNIKIIDNCTTRLRLQLNDTKIVNQAAARASGAAGVNVIDDTNIQIIVGTEVQFVADALQQLYTTGAEIGEVNEAVTEVVTETDDSIISGTTNDFYSVANGEFLNIEDVDDTTFAQKLLGDGYAVTPTDGQIVSPVDGEIMSVFPTKHAIGIKTAAGLEILVHIGINTVELKGEPFDVKVEVGQKVSHGDLLANVDLDAVIAAGKSTTTMVIITNMANVAYLKVSANGMVTGNELVAKATTK